MWRGDKVTELSRGEPTDETGTTITFWPESRDLRVDRWSFETLSRRLQEMAFLVRGLAIHPDRRAARLHQRPADRRQYCYEGRDRRFVRYLNASKEAVHATVIDFGGEGDGISAEIAMQWSGSYSESVHTFANTIKYRRGRYPRGGIPGRRSRRS